MALAKLRAIATLATTLAVTTLANAESPRVAALRASVQDLETRSHAIRRRAEHAGSQVRRESERVVAVVDRRCISVTTRLSVLELLDQDADERPLREMEASLKSADRLLTRAESWYGIR